MLWWFSKYEILIFKYRSQLLLHCDTLKCFSEFKPNWIIGQVCDPDKLMDPLNPGCRSTSFSCPESKQKLFLSCWQGPGQGFIQRCTLTYKNNSLFRQKKRGEPTPQPLVHFSPVNCRNKLVALTVSNNNLCQEELLTFNQFNKATSACERLRASFLSVSSI